MASWRRFSLAWVGCQKQTKKLFILGELAASLQVGSIEETRRKYTFVDFCSPDLAVRYVASLFWPFKILASLPLVFCKTRWTHLAPHKSAVRVAVNVLPPDTADDT